jgi:uncharacterized membrane protein
MTKTIKILIFTSLLLNVLLVGVVVGDLSHRFHLEQLVGSHAQQFASELPEDKAELFLQTVKRVHLKNRDAYKQIQEARKQAMRILAAPEFDEAAYGVQVEKLHELRGFVKRRLADATIELARQFNQEERTALAQHLKHALRPPRDTESPHDERASHHEVP